MHGPGAVLNVMTIPPGATLTGARVVIDGLRGAIFVYEAGNTGPGGSAPLVGSWAGSAGTDPYGNAYPQGFNGVLGVIQGSMIAAGTITSSAIAAGAIVAGLISAGAIDGMTLNAITINGNTVSAADIIVSGTNGGVFVYGTGGTIVQTFTTAGSGSWTAPAGVTSVKAECWGSGGGGAGGLAVGIDSEGGGGGGGGEYAAEPSLAVTPGNAYAYTVAAAGTGGAAEVSGSNGNNSTFAGNTVTVTAHGGQGGQTQPSTVPAALGGTGSTNTTHYNGGNGGYATTALLAGLGGGGSAGTSGAGNNDGANTRSGASAVSGGGPGGMGGGSGSSLSAGSAPATGPGGGGGGGGTGETFGSDQSGGAGWAGQVRLTYTSSSPSLILAIAGETTTDPVTSTTVFAGIYLLNNNVIRFEGTSGETGHGEIGSIAARQLYIQSPKTLSTDNPAAFLLETQPTGTQATIRVTGTLVANVGSADEIWHNITLSLAGWTDGSGTGNGARVKKLPHNRAALDLFIAIATGSTTTDGTTFATLPSSLYYPITPMNIPVTAAKTSTTGAQEPHILVNTNGTLVCYGIFAGQSIGCSATYSLD